MHLRVYHIGKRGNDYIDIPAGRGNDFTVQILLFRMRRDYYTINKTPQPFWADFEQTMHILLRGRRRRGIMNLERITEDNINYAVLIQEQLFPGESARANYEESLDHSSNYEYYLIHHDGACVGIIGLYHYAEDPDSAWLGWFGIQEGYRRKHLGSKALKMFEDMALSKGYRNTRLYTDAVDNEAAIAFYTANGYTSEPYDNPYDPACRRIKTLIFSKSLIHGFADPWKNRNIHLSEQIAKQCQK